jgi:hypothetical protein
LFITKTFSKDRESDMRFHTEENRKLLLLSAVFFLLTAVPFLAAAAPDKKPIAEVLGKSVYLDELTPPDSAEQKKKLDNAAYASWLARRAIGSSLAV